MNPNRVKQHYQTKNTAAADLALLHIQKLGIPGGGRGGSGMGCEKTVIQMCYIGDPIM